MGCASSQPSVNDNEKTPRISPPGTQPILDKTDVTDRLGAKAPAATADVAKQPNLLGSVNMDGHKPHQEEMLLAANTSEPANAQNHVASAASAARPRERRAAAGSEAVRDQIRKLVVGGPQTKEEKAKVYEVSDSEGEDLTADTDLRGWRKPTDIQEAICSALKKNFVFKGIPDDRLNEVVDRMYGVSFRGGSTILQQGALPKADDCMYFLHRGEVDVVISGAVDQSSSSKDNGEEKRVEGNAVKIPQKPGWVFGDIALLFNSARTASVVSKTHATVWALDRRMFLKFVMKYAQGARALRFVRKVPLLKGLSDNDLIRVAGRMPERVYQDTEHLIRYGERGDEMYLIRYGKVRVLRPDDNGGSIEVAVLGRGQFVGERSVINDKLRSADCVAQGQVQVVVLKKKDFMDLDNPLLAWMLDYDAMASVLKSLPAFKRLKQEQMEHLIDRFNARQELFQGDTMLSEGEQLDRMYVVKVGEVRLMQKGQAVVDTEFVKEAGGFTYFGDGSLQAQEPCPYTVLVKSESCHVLCLPRSQLDNFLGAVGDGLTTTESVMEALKKNRVLKMLTDEELSKVAQRGVPIVRSQREVIATCNEPGQSDKLYLVTQGEAALKARGRENGHSQPGYRASASDVSQFMAGDLFNEGSLLAEETQFDDFVLIAASATTAVLCFPRSSIEQALGATLSALYKSRTRHAVLRDRPSIRFQDLELHRIVGTGQFGMVRVVRHVKTNEAYALKVMHKAPIVEGKQIEHVINERKILEEAQHPFCVRLVGAYQDKASLYLLQEWVPGGELFHHLDLEGAFDEPTAMFYAANVLTALEFLHGRGIVYRDLKPENLLLDTQGYVKVADFGFAKCIRAEKTYTICGTPDYQAPEVIMRRGTTKAADYWALGVLIFEMMVGDPPFKSLTGDPWDTFRRTLSGRFYVPNFISDQAADLIFKLLQVNPEKRLGSGRNGAEEIKRHKWFARMDWEALEQRRVKAPIQPRVRNPLDTSNFDNFDSVDDVPPPMPRQAADRQNLWELWDWIDE